MSQIAEQTAEVVAENVEEAIDGMVDVIEIVRNNPIALAIVGSVCLAAGGIGGYFFATKRLKSYYEQLSTEEIADAKEFYANLNKVSVDGSSLSPQDVMEQRHGADAAEALRVYQGGDEKGFPEGTPYDDLVDERQIQKIEKSIKVEKTISSDGAVDVKESINVFVDDTFDIEVEKELRTNTRPYIITHDEYFAAEKDYDTQSLTYYETDDTLCDEHDRPMDEINGTVGDDHLARFGSGSKDKNIVYVRNERLETDYEIVRSPGSYLEEVLDLKPEESSALKHSDNRDRRQAFRRGDG